MVVVKFVELKAYKPDWDAKQMVESENGVVNGHYVTVEQVCELLDQHTAEAENAIDNNNREVGAFKKRIAELEFNLQQAQGGR